MIHPGKNKTNYNNKKHSLSKSIKLVYEGEVNNALIFFTFQSIANKITMTHESPWVLSSQQEFNEATNVIYWDHLLCLKTKPEG